MNPLKIVETSANPWAEVCGTNRPASGKAIVDFGKSENGAVELAGPIMVEPKELANPIVERATPTDDGLVREVARVSETPPAGSLAGKSKF